MESERESGKFILLVWLNDVTVQTNVYWIIIIIIVTLNNIIVYRLLVLDKNTWNHATVF